MLVSPSHMTFIHLSELNGGSVLNLPVDTNNWAEIGKQLDSFGKDAAEIDSFKKAKGELPAWFGTKYALNTPEAEIGVRSPRAGQRSNLFSDDFEEFEEGIPTQEAEAVQPAETPRSVAKPIVVTPDEFVFKRLSSSALSAPPTNIFLQNTTSSPFLIEIEDNSGLLEIVTKAPSAIPQVKIQQLEERDEVNLEPTRAIANFQISAVSH
ncbi:unnamed protein product [Phytophthora fragariaefolia]|uniref:Unnamed protein product n=1 Tax=Phytophthora fragariaefolia TaxID=1490495 RepID=A0A9W6Y210_9STRA|nr:unnamed protein product [Phytophthora fragariaefolia]